MIWKLKASAFKFERPLIMGILNLTPDSFSDGGKFLKPEEAVRRALQLEREGADIIDIGAESTRPHAPGISFEEEKNRLYPVLNEILSALKVPVSLDTTKSKIAELGLESGVSIINDVSGLKYDSKMANLIAESGAGIVLMHRRGTPETMQSLASYKNVVEDVFFELGESIRIALDAGIEMEQIAIDPGLGFSKTGEQNFELIRSLRRFKEFERPILVGASRKSFLGKVTGKNTDGRVSASCAAAALLVEHGADILRVHDVSETRDAIAIAKEMIQ